MDKKQIEKIQAIKDILKEIESLCVEHLEDNPDLTSVHALDLVKGAIEIYEDFMEEVEEID